jgi:DNA-binding transcriptional ArsR family regulator
MSITPPDTKHESTAATPAKTKSAPPERDATPAEMRALAHPLRLRILRVTLHRPLTNKQIAQRLDRDPGTVLHHVRALVAAGFLAAQDVRAGKRGALERPYRATGKSWRVRMLPNRGYAVSVLEAVRDEVVEAGEQSALSVVRLGVRLNNADLARLRKRIADLGDEFEARDDPDGEPVGILGMVYRREV